MEDTNEKIQYRGGELENLLQVRDKFVLLLEKYTKDSKKVTKSKMLGTIFDTIFHIGICNMREHLPSIKEIYLSVGESRNTTLRQLDFLEDLKIITRVTDPDDFRVKRIRLSENFRLYFDEFVQAWVDSRVSS